MLRFEDEAYDDDADMTRILHRLTMAAADADMRHKMDIEDVYISPIEMRDTKILIQDMLLSMLKTLKEQKAQLAQKDELLRMSVRMLLDSGKTIDEIAKNMEMDVEVIQHLAE